MDSFIVWIGRNELLRKEIIKRFPEKFKLVMIKLKVSYNTEEEKDKLIELIKHGFKLKKNQKYIKKKVHIRKYEWTS